MKIEQGQIPQPCWHSVTSAEGLDLADMVDAGRLDLSVLVHLDRSLDKVNQAIPGFAQRYSGFSNLPIQPKTGKEPA